MKEEQSKRDCVFCKIIAKELSSEIIYEDEAVLAFLDIHPVAPGHVLIIPKIHHANIYELPEDGLAKLAAATQAVARKIRENLEAEGINVIMNNGEAAGQVIFHAHIHVIPRFTNDNLQQWPSKSYMEGEAEAIADLLRSSK